MATDAQIAANRANAQKSTGPRTPAGKAAVAYNALSHGLRAVSCVLPREDRCEHAMLADALRRELKPRSPLQQILVERIIAMAWKLRRVPDAENWVYDAARNEARENHHRYQECMVCRADQKPFPDPEDARYLAEAPKLLALLRQFEVSMERSLYQAFAQLERLQKKQADDASDDPSPDPAPSAEVILANKANCVGFQQDGGVSPRRAE